MSAQAMPVFISYAHVDRSHCDRVVASLHRLEERRDISIWYDKSLTPGADYFKGIIDNLGAAKLVLLLVTERFIASKAVAVEVEYALAKQKTTQSKTIPIIVERCAWQSSPFGKLQALPLDARPIIEHPDTDAAWRSISDGVAAAVDSLRRPERDPELEPLTNPSIVEIIQEISQAIAAIRAATAHHPSLNSITIIELAQLERRREKFKLELEARIGRF